MTEDEMVGWHHRLSGHESEQTPGDGDGQGSPACCSPWGHKESDTTKQLNNNNHERGFSPSSILIYVIHVSLCCLVVQSCPTLCDPWTVACQASLSFIISRGLLNLMSTESMKPSSHFILCLSLLLLPSIFPSIRIFSSESVLCIRWPEYWSFNLSCLSLL